jgi:hypothetical protein
MKKIRQIVYYIGPAIFLFLIGCVVIPITTELENPFILQINWDKKNLYPDDTGELPLQIIRNESVTVIVSVFDEYENRVIFDDLDIFEWYLNGELFDEDKDTITLPHSLDKGTYWLDIIVGKDSILSSEHVRFRVEW